MLKLSNKERLIFLLQDSNNPVHYIFFNNLQMNDLADYLISNGVVVKEESEEKNNMKTKSSEILMSLENRSLDVSVNVYGEIIVSYKGAEVQDGIFLIGAYGRGKTFEEACDNYLSEIRGKTLVFDADTKNRKEVTVLG